MGVLVDNGMVKVCILYSGNDQIIIAMDKDDSIYNLKAESKKQGLMMNLLKTEYFRKLAHQN